MIDLKQDETKRALIYTARTAAIVAVLFIVCGSIFISTFVLNTDEGNRITPASKEPAVINAVALIKSRIVPPNTWKAPDETTIPAGEYGNVIRYGKELLAHTSRYFGPNGSIAHITNGMNCQNCHLDGGTKLFANNYSVFYSTYPRISGRSGKIEQASGRIAECFQRSLSGKMPASSSKEIKAMLAYMKWLGGGVKKGDKVFGTGTEKLKYLDRAADAKRGKLLYNSNCTSCHGADGEGMIAEDKLTYVYPPLWGKHSYNDGAGMYRLSNFAGFVKNNMPFGSSYANSQLTDEEAWDLAAYVNSQPRPHRAQSQDYPDLTKKPIDAPYGPYTDEYSEEQHKFGPFEPIVSAARQTKLETK
jgi:thiosulfate dehydrogenase